MPPYAIWSGPCLRKVWTIPYICQSRYNYLGAWPSALIFHTFPDPFDSNAVNILAVKINSGNCQFPVFRNLTFKHFPDTLVKFLLERNCPFTRSFCSARTIRRPSEKETISITICAIRAYCLANSSSLFLTSGERGSKSKFFILHQFTIDYRNICFNL